MRPAGTVFIVDDDAACLDAARELVSSAGLSAETFASASEFLAAFDPARPGCLVLDLRMPRMDGLALQEHLIEIGVRIPIVFTSGHSDIATAVSAIRNGAVDFVQKPYHGSRLLESVLDGLRRDAARRAPAAAGLQAIEQQIAAHSSVPRAIGASRLGTFHAA